MQGNRDEAFRSWLSSVKMFSPRSISDVMSRRRKLLVLVPSTDSRSLQDIRKLLEVLMTEKNFSHGTLTAMMRSERLFREFNQLK